MAKLWMLQWNSLVVILKRRMVMSFLMEELTRRVIAAAFRKTLGRFLLRRRQTPFFSEMSLALMKFITD